MKKTKKLGRAEGTAELNDNSLDSSLRVTSFTYIKQFDPLIK